MLAPVYAMLRFASAFGIQRYCHVSVSVSVSLVCLDFPAFWLAFLESFLVFRTLPALLENAGVERGGEGEDIEMLEERVQGALVKYRED